MPAVEEEQNKRNAANETEMQKTKNPNRLDLQDLSPETGDQVI